MNPETPCTKCAFKLGEHRSSDEACPVPGTFINGDNTRWRLDSTFTPKEEALPAGSDLGPLQLCGQCGQSFDMHNAKGNCPIRFQGIQPIMFSLTETFKTDPGFKNLNPSGAPMYFREPALASSRANLRKVVFARWATLEERKTQEAKDAESQNRTIRNTPGNFRIAKIEGFFHCFGSSYEEFEAGPGNYSTAIVEDMSGQVFEIFPSDMKFLS